MKVYSLLLFLLFLNALFANSPHIYPNETPIVKYLKSLDIDDSLPTGIDLIDCIYVINLDERPDKWTRVKRLFDAKNLNVCRVRAVNGWKLKDAVISEMCGPYGKRVTKGHYGCMLSHLSILQDALTRGFEMIWICEDDIEFVNDIKALPRLLKTLSQIDPEWDIFYTDIRPRILQNGCIIHYRHPYSSDMRPDQHIEMEQFTERNTFVDSEIMKISLRTGTTSMIISKKGIEKILNYFTHVYIWNPIDNELHFIPGIREYTPTRDIVSNLISSDSDTARLNY